MITQNIRKKSIVFLIILIYIAIFSLRFTSENLIIAIGLLILAVFNLENDLTIASVNSLIKIIVTLTFIFIISLINAAYPVSIITTVLTFLVVFSLIFSSNQLFTNKCHIGYLMLYYMMLYSPVANEQIYLRFASLIIGALFIVLVNFIVFDKKKDDNYFEDIKSVLDEIDERIDICLMNYKTNKGLDEYFESKLASIETIHYKYKSTTYHESMIIISNCLLNISGCLLSNKLDTEMLLYLREKINIIKKDNFDVQLSIDGQANVLKEKNYDSILILHLYYIQEELKKIHKSRNLKNIDKIRKTIKNVKYEYLKSNLSRQSPKFTFSLKIAILLTLWNILSFIGIPYHKWLNFATLAILIPYMKDYIVNAKSRLMSSICGVMTFASLIISILHYYPTYIDITLILFLLVSIYLILIFLENSMACSILGCLISLTVSLKFMPLTLALPLKILYLIVVIAFCAILNYIIFQYSNKNEIYENLKFLSKINYNMIIDASEKDASKLPSYILTSNLLVYDIVKNIDQDNENTYNMFKHMSDVNFKLDLLLCNIRYGLPDELIDKQMDSLLLDLIEFMAYMEILKQTS